MKTLFNIAHRGFSGQYPENTLIAFRKAAEIGADMVEMDVTLSKDGEVVVLHDDTLDRTTDGRGWVGEYTLAQLKRLDAGRWFAPSFAGERIPTLDEALALLKTTPATVCIELKRLVGHDDADVPHFIEKVLALVHRWELGSRMILMGKQAHYLAIAAQFDPQVVTAYNPGYARLRGTGHTARLALACGAQMVTPDYRWVTRGLINSLHARGLSVLVWTINRPWTMRRAIAQGADGIITNHPNRLKALLNHP